MWEALPADVRGTFHAATNRGAHRHAAEIGIPVTAGRRPSTDPGLVVVAAYQDLARVGRRPAVLMEHGAGQSYTDTNRGYAGGDGRDTVVLFLCPNEHSAGRNRAAYPFADVVTVGCPKLDRWLRNPPRPDPSVIALSWHWPNTVIPEARSALEEYRPVLADAVASWRADGFDVIGHAHPRANGTLAPVYAELGVPHVHDFADVIERASVYVCDNSSTMFEAAALGRTVVVVNSRHYRRDVEHGLRFWSHSGIGPHVNTPAEFGPTVLAAAHDRPMAPPALLEDVYGPADGHAADRAATAILGVLGR